METITKLEIEMNQSNNDTKQRLKNLEVKKNETRQNNKNSKSNKRRNNRKKSDTQTSQNGKIAEVPAKTTTDSNAIKNIRLFRPESA
ncbi:hypothetical protein RhiirA5_438152 [Rhizophagus irregularis]|uniref:Uncharacterized protein n=1 Tax=Rhizophagus irregularis TaxID=588596 RepID=A0A2N0NJK4_9GLOM|nr:hypothetical protein RhiirA5_438152 [Rhizophagus irregularis]